MTPEQWAQFLAENLGRSMIYTMPDGTKRAFLTIEVCMPNKGGQRLIPDERDAKVLQAEADAKCRKCKWWEGPPAGVIEGSPEDPCEHCILAEHYEPKED